MSKILRKLIIEIISLTHFITSDKANRKRLKRF